jgi:hypothetical protein
VYFSQAFSGNFYALDAFTGKPLATLARRGAARRWPTGWYS